MVDASMCPGVGGGSGRVFRRGDPDHALARVRISVVICTWNRAGLLRETLRSLNEQVSEDGIEFETIVVDNNSTDSTKAVVAELSRSWKHNCIRYVFEPKQGKQFALNAGVMEASGEIVSFTDDDISLPPSWIKEISYAFEDDEVDVVGGRTIVQWPETGVPNWYRPSMAAVVGDVNLGPERIVLPERGYAPAGANLVVRRSVFDRIGLFSVNHFRHMDQEFGERAFANGLRVEYWPSIVVYAPVPARTLNKRYFRRWAFKAGIEVGGERAVGGGRFFTVPLWLYRRLMSDAFRIFYLNLRGKADDAFEYEFRTWRHLGLLISNIRRRFGRRHHLRWVEKMSQKVNDTYS